MTHLANVTISSTIATILVTQELQISTENENKHSIEHIASDNKQNLLTTLSIQVRTESEPFLTKALKCNLFRKWYHIFIFSIKNGSQNGKKWISLECQSIYQNYIMFLQLEYWLSNDISILPNIPIKK